MTAACLEASTISLPRGVSTATEAPELLDALPLAELPPDGLLPGAPLPMEDARAAGKSAVTTSTAAICGGLEPVKDTSLVMVSCGASVRSKPLQ